MQPEEFARSKGDVSIRQVTNLLGPLVEEGLQCQLGFARGPPPTVTVMVRNITPALIVRIRARLSPLDAKIVVIEDPTASLAIG